MKKDNKKTNKNNLGSTIASNISQALFWMSQR